MIDDDATLPSGRYNETLVYDFSKFLTSLSLLILGGVLALLPTLDKAEVKPFTIAMVLVMVSMGGATALSTANAIVEARAADRTPKRNLRRYLQAAVGLIGIGTGAFLMLWWDALN